ncbi:MAG: Rrf2 family transcriptional regulator, partial [Deltaproteobacteria bacterium]|nr:Rrf2 family transcriptional regulator [Deltaproteobacteria bacterium]MBW2365025.1 Rrf2 family transcriptional regulator [Deltaproteobacteria bacterium]
MRLTTKSRYGTRLLLDLAIYSKKKPVRLSDVSKRQGISLKYLEKLIRNLKQAGYVKSIRGPYGGYMLAKPTKEISVGDIVRIMEDSQT